MKALNLGIEFEKNNATVKNKKKYNWDREAQSMTDKTNSQVITVDCGF